MNVVVVALFIKKETQSIRKTFLSDFSIKKIDAYAIQIPSQWNLKYTAMKLKLHCDRIFKASYINLNTPHFQSLKQKQHK